jgi:hypothetical protein
MKRTIKAGTTDFNLTVIAYDNTSTSGAGLSGLTHTTSGLILEYRRSGDSSWTQLGVGTGLVAGTLGSYVSGGIVASGSRSGRYQIGIPNGAIAAGATFVEICLRGATNMHPVDIEIQLDAVDYQTDAFGALKPTTAGRTLDVSSGGEAGIDLANVGSPSTTLNLSGTTIKTATDIEVDTQDIQNRLPSGLVGGRMASIAEVVGDKTGYKLASDGLSLVTSWAVGITGNITGNLSGSVGSVTGNVGGNVTGSVGSIAGVTFPTGFGTWTAPLTTSGTASAVWDALIASYTVTNSFGARVVRSLNSNNTLQLTGSHHAAADLHELQPAVIDNTHFAAGAIDSNALAASAATEIATAVGALTQLVDLTTMIVNDGTANARFSTSALQNAPSGGGGGGTGTGARTVVVTVALSASPVEGASVRLTKAAETYVGSTNASGQVTFNVDDGTWTVAITSPGATFAGASLVVDDDEAVSYSLTAISITPSPATQITGYYTCYSHLGVVEAGVSITMQLVGLAQGSVGLALDNRLRTVTSNASGVAQFTNLFPGCRYKVYRGAAENKAWYVNLPDTVTGDPVELGSIYGDDE